MNDFEIAHNGLHKWLEEFDKSAGMNVHNFMELSIFTMINLAITNIDKYLESGHKSVDEKEIITIVLDSYQAKIDSMRRKLEGKE